MTLNLGDERGSARITYDERGVLHVAPNGEEVRVVGSDAGWQDPNGYQGEIPVLPGKATHVEEGKAVVDDQFHFWVVGPEGQRTAFEATRNGLRGSWLITANDATSSVRDNGAIKITVEYGNAVAGQNLADPANVPIVRGPIGL